MEEKLKSESDESHHINELEGFGLKVGQRSKRMIYAASSLDSIRYLGMNSENTFAVHFLPLDDRSHPFNCFYPLPTREFDFSGKAEYGETKYTFHVKKVNPREIVFSKVIEDIEGDYTYGGID